MRPTLHVLGCGRAAGALARVLVERHLVDLGQIANSNINSARQAAEFIGAGEPVTRLKGELHDDWLMIGVPDGQIEGLANDWANTVSWTPGLAFHLSGSVESKVLGPICRIHASVHPLKAFADPARAVVSFSDTWCTAEGKPEALSLLKPLFESAGGRWVEFSPANKAAWHAATVSASNFLVVTNALARNLAEAAGMDGHHAAAMLADLQRGTLDNLDSAMPAQALTGPIERGDVDACRRLQQSARDCLGPNQSVMFDQLARCALELAVEKRGRHENDDQLARLFAS